MLSVAFSERGQKTICVEILYNIMEEMRKDRKIRMTIKDKNLDAYIMLSLENIPPVEQQDPFLR